MFSVCRFFFHPKRLVLPLQPLDVGFQLLCAVLGVVPCATAGPELRRESAPLRRLTLLLLLARVSRGLLSACCSASHPIFARATARWRARPG